MIFCYLLFKIEGLSFKKKRFSLYLLLKVIFVVVLRSSGFKVKLNEVLRGIILSVSILPQYLTIAMFGDVMYPDFSFKCVLFSINYYI